MGRAWSNGAWRIEPYPAIDMPSKCGAQLRDTFAADRGLATAAACGAAHRDHIGSFEREPFENRRRYASGDNAANSGVTNRLELCRKGFGGQSVEDRPARLVERVPQRPGASRLDREFHDLFARRGCGGPLVGVDDGNQPLARGVNFLFSVTPL